MIVAKKQKAPDLFQSVWWILRSAGSGLAFPEDYHICAKTGMRPTLKPLVLIGNDDDRHWEVANKQNVPNIRTVLLLGNPALWGEERRCRASDDVRAAEVKSRGELEQYCLLLRD